MVEARLKLGNSGRFVVETCQLFFFFFLCASCESGCYLCWLGYILGSFPAMYGSDIILRIFDPILKTENLDVIQDPISPFTYHRLYHVEFILYVCPITHQKRASTRKRRRTSPNALLLSFRPPLFPQWYLSFHSYTTTRLKKKTNTKTMHSKPYNNNMHHLLRRHIVPRYNLPPTTMQTCFP